LYKGGKLNVFQEKTIIGQHSLKHVNRGLKYHLWYIGHITASQPILLANAGYTAEFWHFKIHRKQDTNMDIL